MTRCKFKCESVQMLAPNNGKCPRNVVLLPVYSSDPNSENKKFWDYTPSGKLEFTYINDSVNFEPGKEYYIDITEAKGE